MRTDIQALRAAAVLMVIGNHLFPERLTGGYVGVDIFFVISGFLITSHLLRETDGTGTVKLGAFWARRARRLLPAALLVLAVAAAIVLLKAPMPVWEQNLTQIALAAVYGLNWLLAGDSINYFAQGDGQTLVVHYWSLSVEEQFYLVWPLVVLVVYGVAKGLSPQGRRRLMAGAFGAILLGSFAWATVSTALTPSAAYFQTTGRAWEFAAGGLIAMLPAVSAVWRTRLIPVVWLSWVALALVTIVFGPTWGVPGAAALIPVAATAAIIAIGESDRWFGTARVTGFWPIRTTGDISYSAYLWHWLPIAAYPWFIFRGLVFTDKLIIFIATLIVAYLSKRFVEDPVRTGRPASWPPARTIAIGLVGMAVVFGSTFSGATTLRTTAERVSIELAADAADPGPCFGVQAQLSGATCADSHVVADAGYILLGGIWDISTARHGGSCSDFDIGGSPEGSCTFGVPEGEQDIDIAVVGDSHSFVWAPGLDRVADRYGARVHVYAKGWCSATADLDVQFAGRTDAEMDNCNEWRTGVIDAIAESRTIDLVVTSAYNAAYLTDRGTGGADDGHGYADAWRQWLEAGKKVVAIADTPTYPTSLALCTEDTSKPDPCATSLLTVPNALTSAAASISDPHFAFVDYTDIFCDTICHSVIGGLPVTRDGGHLTMYVVQSFGDSLFRDEFERVLTAR